MVLELYQHVCVYFGSFEKLDGYGICESAKNENDQVMESILNIDFLQN